MQAKNEIKTWDRLWSICSLLTKLIRSRWLDINLVLFLRFYGPRWSSVDCKTLQWSKLKLLFIWQVIAFNLSLDSSFEIPLFQLFAKKRLCDNLSCRFTLKGLNIEQRVEMLLKRSWIFQIFARRQTFCVQIISDFQAEFCYWTMLIVLLTCLSNW